MKYIKLAFILIVASACMTSGCTKESQTPVGDTEVAIVNNGTSDYKIVFEDSTTEQTAKELVKAFKSLTGAQLSAVSAKTAGITAGEKTPFEKAIRISNSKSLILSKSEGEAYGIVLNGKCLIIEGSDKSTLAQALFYFTDNFLRKAKSGSLILDKNYSYIKENLPPLTIKECLKQQYTYSIENAFIGDVAPEGTINVSQGAASDGTYVYVVMRTSDEKQAMVFKYQLSPFKYVSKSAVFYAGHCNDMTYCTANGKLYVAHGSSEGKILTPITASSLNVLDDINITMGSGAITYDTVNDRFAISQGGSTLYVADQNFKQLNYYKRTDSTGYTAQGMGCDDQYVYFPMSGSGDNILATYTWNGVYVGPIKINVALESESMFFVNGKYYISFYRGSGKGSAIYQAIPKIQYKFK